MNEQLVANLEVALAVAKNPERKCEWLNTITGTWLPWTGNPVNIMTGDGSQQFRLAPIAFPSPPPGDSWHNPNNLDAETVGVQDGWRLLLESEWAERNYGFPSAHRLHRQLQGWNRYIGVGWSAEKNNGSDDNATYRTRLPLPSRPVLRDWDRPGDVPGPVCWILSASGTEHCYLAIAITPLGVYLADGSGTDLIKWAELKDRKYSTTRNPDDWHPCKVQEGGK